MDQETLYRFFNGQTTEEEESALRAWVEESTENERLFIEERKLYDSITLLKEESDLQHMFLHKADSDIYERRRIPLFREIFKIASVAIITFFVAYFLIGNKQEEVGSMAMQTISVPAGQRINISLPDGTNVWLNARTTIQYPVSFNSKERSVKLDGQAYFDVKHNEDIPFVVETEKGNVRVLGTKFDILSYSGSDLFETALMDGKVEVFLASDPKQTIILSPDTKAYLENGKLHKASLIDLNPYRWKEGLISFVNSSFGDIMKEFEKSYGITIVIQNKTLSNYSYTGKFLITDGIDYALRVLQKDLRFTYNRDSDKNILYIQ